MIQSIHDNPVFSIILANAVILNRLHPSSQLTLDSDAGPIWEGSRSHLPRMRIVRDLRLFPMRVEFRQVSLRLPRSLRGSFLSAGLCVVLCLISGTMQAQQRATLSRGQIVEGQFSGTAPKKLEFRPAGNQRPIPLNTVQSVLFDSEPGLPRSSTPLRRLLLHAGEQIRGELLESGATAPDATVRLRGGAVVKLARGVLTGITQPPAQFNLLYEDFEKMPCVFTGVAGKAALDGQQHQSGEFSLAIRQSMQPLKFEPAGTSSAGSSHSSSLKATRVHLSFFDDAVLDSARQWSVAFVFPGMPKPTVLSAVLGGDDVAYRCPLPGGTQFVEQPLRRSSGWHHLTLWFEPERAMVIIDQHLLATGTGLPDPLEAVVIAVESSPAAGSGTKPPPQPASPDEAKAERDTGPIVGWVDDFKLEASVLPLAIPANPEHDDLLLTRSGDEIFGNLTALDQRSISLRGVFGQRQFPWAETRALIRRRQSAPAAPGIQGLITRVEFSNFPGDGLAEPDWLSLAVLSVADDELRGVHPWLGELRFPLREVRRLTPEFLGRRWVLSPGFRHLGDEVHEDFRAPFPEGHQMAASWTLDSVPRGVRHVSLAAAHLEPSGPRTPLDHPFLDQLTQGHLRTELFINDTRVDDINRYASQRGTSQQPVSIRVPVPARFLKVGLNTLRLQQRPSRDDPRNFDDFEFSNLAFDAAGE